MKHLNRARLRRMAVVSAVALVACWAWSAPTGSAAGTSQLLQKAIQDTNTVRTLTYTDRTSVKTKTRSVDALIRGAEDEVQNREHDYESVTVTTAGQNNATPSTLHYTADVIFVNGKTYYRSSRQGNQWKVQSGTAWADPYTGGGFRRGRTKVQFSPNFKFTEVGGTAGGETHVRALVTARTGSATVDLWISSGSTPYVVREDEKVQVTAPQSSAGTETVRFDFGPFNRPLNIQPPPLSST